MKLRKGFITHTMNEEQMMVAAGSAANLFHGMVQSNETAAFIVDCLKKETTERAIVDKMMKKYYGVDRETVEKDVHEILVKLESIHAIEGM